MSGPTPRLTTPQASLLVVSLEGKHRHLLAGVLGTRFIVVRRWSLLTTPLGVVGPFGGVTLACVASYVAQQTQVAANAGTWREIRQERRRMVQLERVSWRSMRDRGCGLRNAVSKMIEGVGMTLVFLFGNLAVGVIAIVAAHIVTRRFMSPSLLDDLT